MKFHEFKMKAANEVYKEFVSRDKELKSVEDHDETMQKIYFNYGLLEAHKIILNLKEEK